jgi:DNA-3-methyladenine glycosylase
VTLSPFPRAFYASDAESVAKALLGATLVFQDKRVRIVETEAYVGPHDLAAHSSRGRTPRTEVMFGPPGHAYVYLIYGMYELLNVVTGAEGDAQAVLIRSAEPLSGALAGETDGPGKLTRALGLTRTYNRHDLTVPPLTIAAGTPPARIVTTTRVGVDYAGPWKDAPLRFYDADSPYVSRR